MQQEDDMKKGERVKIFTDPITRQCLEGEATIIRVLPGGRAIVRFDGERETYERQVVAS